MWNKVHLVLMFLGMVGMIIIASISIIDSQATDIASAIPVQLLFVAMFLAGYIKYEKNS